MECITKLCPVFAQVLSPFIYNATKELLATNFQSPELELPRRMAANPQLYERVRSFVNPNRCALLSRKHKARFCRPAAAAPHGRRPAAV